MATIETIFPWDQEQCNEAATELCDCWDAKRYTSRKEQKEKAQKAIARSFGEQAGENEVITEVISLLNQAAELVVEEEINSITVDIGDGLKAKIAITSKGFVKVERTKTEKATQEA